MIQVNAKVRVETNAPCIVDKTVDDLFALRHPRYKVGKKDARGKIIAKGETASVVDGSVRKSKVYKWVDNDDLPKEKETRIPHKDGGRYMPRGEFDTEDEAVAFAKTL
jgi:hypothetical protein